MGSNAGTIGVSPLIYVGDTPSINLDYNVAEGGQNPPPLCTFSADDPTILTASGSGTLVPVVPPVAGFAFSYTESVELAILKAGETVLHASQDGNDLSDLTVITTAVPVTEIGWDLSSLTNA